MKSDQLESLIDLYGQISGLQVVKCRLAHERVKMEAETSLPVRSFLPEAGYVRTAFCASQERNARLSCGHTTARYVLEAAIRLLDEPVQTVLQIELNELTNQIHSLDHQKGDAEKRLAGLIWEKHSGTKSTGIEKEMADTVAQIDNIERKHSDCVERIDGLRHRVLEYLKAVIANSDRNCETTY